ncbi:MAG: hypothetical protein KC736_04470 [Candidatus Moranbacteria bacterium]|nr:hypothetical protein [Candidatus Moranbacteria bacterium]
MNEGTRFKIERDTKTSPQERAYKDPGESLTTSEKVEKLKLGAKEFNLGYRYGKLVENFFKEKGGKPTLEDCEEFIKRNNIGLEPEMIIAIHEVTQEEKKGQH